MHEETPDQVNEKKFSDLLLMYTYHYSKDEMNEKARLWSRYINLDNISERNFLSSKFALTIADLNTVFANNQDFFKKFIQVTESIKRERTFRTTDGHAFELFCYSLFSNPLEIVDIDGLKIKEGIKRCDFSTLSENFEAEIKSNKLLSIQKNQDFIVRIIDDILKNYQLPGILYFDISFENQKEDQFFSDSIGKNLSTILKKVIDLIKKELNAFPHVGELFLQSVDNFCQVKIIYFNKRVDYNTFWLGHDIAGTFVDAHISSPYYLSINYLRLNYNVMIERWLIEKEVLLKITPFFLFFTTTTPIFDIAQLKSAFTFLKGKYPQLKATFYIDYWYEHKIAKVTTFYTERDEIISIISKFDTRKVDVEEIEC